MTDSGEVSLQITLLIEMIVNVASFYNKYAQMQFKFAIIFLKILTMRYMSDKLLIIEPLGNLTL